MEDTLIIILSLLAAVALLSVLSNKIGVAYPIFLVIAGLILSFIPAVPSIQIEPEVIFIIFLPPLLFSAAWQTSWRDFWYYKRAILLLAIGLVIFTSLSIAFLSNALIPGFTLAAGFLLGGIISPSDAIAATSIIKRLKVPKRVVTILEGESLINDASSLIVFRFALIAVSTGQFVWYNAATNFFLVAGGGILIGVVLALGVYLFYKYMPTDAAIDTSVLLITPYLMYIIAEHFHCSGVLSVVSGGLFLSFRSNTIFNYESRMRVISVYSSLEFLMNGVLFILIGLELKVVVSGMRESSLPMATFYALIISLAAVIIRIIWVYPGTYLPRLSKKIRNRERSPSWRAVFIVAWSGMRGVVSLAAALAIPETIDGERFPHRNLILYITFCVILFTLVIQGLSLPLLIKWLKIKVDSTNDEEDRLKLNQVLGTAVLEHLKNNYSKEIEANNEFKTLIQQYSNRMQRAEKMQSEPKSRQEIKDDIKKRRKILIELLEMQRTMVEEMRKNGDYPDELLRNREYELDLEEARLRRIGAS